MKRPLAFGCLLVTVSVLLALSAPSLRAQPAGPFALTGTSGFAGGGTITGSAYSLASSIGQPEPGPTQRGGGYTLNGGLVNAGSSGVPAMPELPVYLPHVVRYSTWFTRPAPAPQPERASWRSLAPSVPAR